jgi:hypothetical protein
MPFVSIEVAPGINYPFAVTGSGTPSDPYVLSVASSGGGGGAATIADGADVAEGAKADAVATTTGSWSVISLLKALVNALVLNAYATNDGGPSWVSAHGIAGIPFTSADQHSAPAPCTSAPTSGKKLVITDLIFSTDTAMSVTFTEETSGTVIAGPFYVPANFAGQFTPRSVMWKLPTINTRLQVQTSVAGHITVDPGYYSSA